MPAHAAAECLRCEFRHFGPIVVEPEAAAAGESRSVEDGIVEYDFACRISAAAAELAFGENTLATEIDAARRGQGTAQNRAQVLEPQPAPIPKLPVRVREVREFGLGVNLRMAEAEDSLFRSEAGVREGELDRNIGEHGQVSLRRKIHLLPLHRTDIECVPWRTAGSERNAKCVAFDRERGAHVVVQDPAVLESEFADVHVEEPLAERL